ncbi:MAG: hypothetical protein ACE5JX_10520 [Acidobacteriota bacterium]
MKIRCQNAADVQQDRLRALDTAGNVCWEYRRSDLDTNQYGGSAWQSLGGRSSLVTDLDSDGRNEVLFVLRPKSRMDTTDQLACFSSGGQMMWTFPFGRRLFRGEREFAPAFVGGINGLVRVGAEKYLHWAFDKPRAGPAAGTL